MSAASITSNAIVVEVLNRENYLNWSALMENYLRGNGLWCDIIEGNAKDDDEKNRRALHAIQLSCGKALGQIRKFTKAKEAWDHLKTSFSEEVKARRQDPPQTRFDSSEDQSTSPLQIFVRKGFLDDAKLGIDISPDEVFFRSPDDGRTVLHVAVKAGHVELVKKLVKMGKQRLLKMQDKKGYTALALAAKLTDNKEMAELMVETGGVELLTIASRAEEDDKGVDDEIPVLLASDKGHKKVTRYLFNKTPWSVLRQNSWQYGVVLLSRCINNEILDVAAAILQHFDAQQISLSHAKKELRPIYALARIPSAFPSTGTKLNWWERFIYNICKPEDLNNETIKIVLHEPDEIQSPKIMTHTLPGLSRLFGRFRQFVQISILLKFRVFERIYNEKKDHYLVLVILNCLCKRISVMSERELLDEKVSAYDAMLQAAKNGITEFIELMSGANPDLLLAMDESKRGIFVHAIVNRRAEVFQLIHGLQSNKEIITSREDTLGNNLLHIAAELGPSRYLDPLSNAALQMQRELQWFQEVKEVMPQWCHEAKDANGKMASEVFTDDHKELLKSGQQWAKETASSFTLVGTLIITIMFAAAFTVPGGNSGDKGTPIFLGKDIFTFFIVSDAISLVTSSSSVLMFIGILTSRYAEEDFNKSLPLKLLFGLVTLFLSVASMMCAFCAALALVLQGYRRIVIAAMWLALLPILVFVPSLLRLASEISQSTMRFDKLAAKKHKNRGLI
ncbi:Ankyrin repeat-containing protein [Spatholobus suberectus]|nr:Ankyrin repeat-containing protein [Spatholobus suberectus]